MVKVELAGEATVFPQSACRICQQRLNDSEFVVWYGMAGGEEINLSINFRLLQ